jgi:hypothetical protein
VTAAARQATIVVVDQQAAMLDLALRVEIDAVTADGSFLDRTDPTLRRKLELAQHGLRVLYLSSLPAPLSLDSLVSALTDLIATSPPDRLRAAPSG